MITLKNLHDIMLNSTGFMNEKWSKYQISGLPGILGLLPIFSIVFSEKWVPFYIAILLVAFYKEPRKMTNFRTNRHLFTPFAIMIAVFILYTVISLDIFLSLKVLERQVSLFLLPVIIFSVYWNSSRLSVFFKTFLYGLILFCVFSFCYLLWFYVHYQDWIETANQAQHTSTYLQFKFPHLVGVHPTYWSYLLIVGNIIVLANFFFHFLNNRYIVYIVLIVFNCTIFFLAARTPILINAIVHIMALVLYLSTKGKFSMKMILKSITVIFALGVIVPTKMPLIFAKMEDVSNDERFFLWPVAIKQIKDNFFIVGEGPGLGKATLHDFVLRNEDPRENYRSFDLHNQYLTHYLDMGILGFLALLHLFFYPLFLKENNHFSKSFLVWGIIILFSVGCITEASLYRLKGIIIFSIFYPMFLSATQYFSKRESLN